jgi:tellurite resistance protein
MDFFKETEVTAAQAEVIARGMLAVARAEGGARKAELELVKAFYSDVVGGGARHVASLEQAPDLTPEVAATALSSEPLARLFVKSCILAGYADGAYSTEERQVVDRFAKALGLGKGVLEELEQSVKEYLVSHLSGLSNVEATASIARKLKL